jgi:hypothetical protein
MKLRNLIFNGMLALSVAGCSFKDYSMYEFGGEISAERNKKTATRLVKFNSSYDGIGGTNNTLKLTDNKTIIELRDYTNDLKFEEVIITKNGLSTPYYKYKKEDKSVVEAAQEEADFWMSQIPKAKIERGLENLK